MRTKAPGLEVVTRDRATQKKSPDGANPTAQPIVAPLNLQSRGQLTRALALDQQADRLAAFGAWPAVRKLRHEANRLRRLARGRGPKRNDHFDRDVSVVVVEDALAVGRLERWAARSAA